MSEIGKGTVTLFAILAFFYFLTSVAFGQTMTRSHGCYALDDAKILSHHLIEHEWVGYNSLFGELHAEGRCVPVLIPVPAPGPPIWSVHSNSFDVGVFLLQGKSGIIHGLLLGKYTRASGA